jgi:hypothetical protein
MRKAFNNFSIIKDSNTFYGISLGFDYCAEHEWGIEDMRNKLGIIKDSKKLGIENRIITKHDCVKFIKEGDKAVLTSFQPWNKKENLTLKDLTAMDLEHSKGELATAWSERDFFFV